MRFWYEFAHNRLHGFRRRNIRLDHQIDRIIFERIPADADDASVMMRAGSPTRRNSSGCGQKNKGLLA